jgi:hypothetical protein
MKTPTSDLIQDSQSLVSVTNQFGRKLPVYDDGYGPLFIHRDSMGISGIVRAQTWEDAYSICQDEFFPSAGEEANDEPKTDHDQACWDESFGFRPNGKGGPTPEKDFGIYAKDLNGDRLDLLTPQLLSDLGLTLEIVENE